MDEEITRQQDRFQELWNKCADDTATPQERAEMFKMQMDYWEKRESDENKHSDGRGS